MNCIKLKNYPGENVKYSCAEILVDDERLESAGAFSPEHLGHVTCIFKDTSYFRFRHWGIQKYKEVMDYIKKLRVCDINVISPEQLITYESLVQEAMWE